MRKNSLFLLIKFETKKFKKLFVFVLNEVVRKKEIFRASEIASKINISEIFHKPSSKNFDLIFFTNTIANIIIYSLP